MLISWQLIQFFHTRIQFVVSSFESQKFLMISSFNNLPLFQDHDGIGVPDRGKTVGYDKRGAVRHEPVHAVFNVFLSPGIHGAGGLVQDQHRSFGNGCPRNIKELSLPLA